MRYILIGLCLVVVVVCLKIFLKNKMNQNEKKSVVNIDNSIVKEPTKNEESTHNFLIQMEMLPTEYQIDDNKLIEITDSKILAKVNNLVPGLVQVGNVANNAVRAVQANSEVLYRAIIPSGAKLTNSKAMEGAVRGFYHSADGVKGHANLVSVEAQNGTAIASNTVAAAMGVASMVVG